MAFPTSNSSGYADVRKRVALALGRCQEETWLDFKESQPWELLKWRLLRTMMAMANCRDGGLIIVGLEERESTWKLTGIQPAHLATFDFDTIIDQLGKYTNPQVKVDIVLHEDEERRTYLVFSVRQFGEAPVFCAANSPDALKPNDRLRAGDIFVRSTTGRPKTERATSADLINDLLMLAAELRARRMLETGKRIGLVEPATSQSQIDVELPGMDELPVPVKAHPFWEIRFRPAHHDPDLIPSLTECTKLVEKTRVRLRGWDFPHLSRRPQERATGSNWISSWSNFWGSIEYWQLFQSGQFLHVSAVREAARAGWREKLRDTAKSHLGHSSNDDLDHAPGFMSLENLVYTVTEVFEFAARISQAGVYRDEIEIRIRLHGVKGFVLTPDWDKAWSDHCAASENDLHRVWRISASDLIAGSASHALKAIVWLCECFGWIEPNITQLEKDVAKYLQGRG